MNSATKVKAPPEKTSDEAKPQGLRYAREQGDAFDRTISYMTDQVAQRGEKRRAGEYIVGYAIEKAEGLYHLRHGKLQWVEPGKENIHIEIVVCDGADGRFIPGLNVWVTITGEDGQDIGSKIQPFLWHPYLYHYGLNWTVPGDGRYPLRVDIEPPNYPRHDRINGERYTQPVTVEFPSVKFETGHG